MSIEGFNDRREIPTFYEFFILLPIGLVVGIARLVFDGAKGLVGNQSKTRSAA